MHRPQNFTVAIFQSGGSTLGTYTECGQIGEKSEIEKFEPGDAFEVL